MHDICFICVPWLFFCYKVIFGVSGNANAPFSLITSSVVWFFFLVCDTVYKDSHTVFNMDFYNYLPHQNKVHVLSAHTALPGTCWHQRNKQHANLEIGTSPPKIARNISQHRDTCDIQQIFIKQSNLEAKVECLEKVNIWNRDNSASLRILILNDSSCCSLTLVILTFGTRRQYLVQIFPHFILPKEI